VESARHYEAELGTRRAEPRLVDGPVVRRCYRANGGPRRLSGLAALDLAVEPLPDFQRKEVPQDLYIAARHAHYVLEPALSRVLSTAHATSTECLRRCAPAFPGVTRQSTQRTNAVGHGRPLAGRGFVSGRSLFVRAPKAGMNLVPPAGLGPAT
jgi:hypothetical protein